MVADTLIIVALVVGSIVVLITLGKISRQLDNLPSLIKLTDKKITEANLISSQTHWKLDRLEKIFKELKGDKG